MGAGQNPATPGLHQNSWGLYIDFHSKIVACHGLSTIVFNMTKMNETPGFQQLVLKGHRQVRILKGPCRKITGFFTRKSAQTPEIPGEILQV